MNSNSKLDSHPDAESLNAFAEQALSERERGEILAHLAECGRCREVVFLAQAAAAEMEPEFELAVAAAAAPDAIRRKERWFRSWRFAWVPIGALAAGLFVAYIAHVRHEEIVGEQARAAGEVAAHNIEMASTPQTPPMGQQAAPPPASASSQYALKSLKAHLPSLVAGERAPVVAPPPSSAIASRGSADAGLQPGADGAGGPALDAVAEYRLEPALGERRQEQERAAGAFEARSLGVEKRSELKAGASAGEPEVRNQAEKVIAAAAPMAQVGASSAKSGDAETNERYKKAGACALYKAKTAALPSSLLSVSTVMTQGRTIAVDGAGGVFLSEDAGGHWVSVAKQWIGRVVAVRLQAKMGASAGIADVPEGAFEIVNDQGLIWVSADGRIWKAK
jgi:hypothetical protein